jgi:PEP-CTERM motif
VKQAVLLALLLILFSPRAKADSASSDVVIQVSGSIRTSQGETFSVSYQQDMTTYAAPTDLTYSSSGPLGAFTLSNPGASGGSGLGFETASGYFLSLLLFQSPGCGTTQTAECEPEVGPGEVFPPGTNVNAFANGLFLLFNPGQSTFSQSFFGDVTVSLVQAPEPGTLLLLGAGLAGLAALKRR